MELTQYDEDLPENAGIIWALPMAASSPAAQKFEVNVFMQGTEENSKTHHVLNTEGELNDHFFMIGVTQSWLFLPNDRE